MKSTLIIFTLFFIYLATYSQITFNKLESIGVAVMNATNVKSIGDNYFIQYTLIDSMHNYGMGVLKTDEYGNFIKDVRYVDTTGRYETIPFKNGIASSDSSFIVAANRYYSQQTYKMLVKIWKFDINLDTIWTMVIEHPDTVEASIPGAIKIVEISDMVETLDGGYLLSISYNRKCITPTNYSNQRALLMKIDASGNVEWVNRNNEDYKVLYSLDNSSDSGYFIPAIRGNVGLPFKLNKFDKFGNYEYEVVANNHSTQTNAIASCEYDSSSAIMATYYKLSAQIGELGVSVSKINTISKTVEWNKDFIVVDKMLSIAHTNAYMDIRIDNNGGIYIATSGSREIFTPWHSVVHNGIVLKLNSNGDSLWTRYYDHGSVGEYDTELQDFMILDDGSFIGVGYGHVIYGGISKLWFFKTKIGGYLGTDEKGSFMESGIFVYPNPASEMLIFSFKDKLKNNAELIIYNSIGQIINTYSVDKSRFKFEININNYQTGFYFYELKDNYNMISIGKFVKD